MKINIVLHEPEIPQNTGNIARTCAATGAALHIIRPTGFDIDNKKLKRAGLDYWNELEIYYYDNLTHFFKVHPDADFFCFSTKSPKAYHEIIYPPEPYLIFGKETKGLPENFLTENFDRCVRLPMRKSLRSLNLSNAVAISVYEVLRQNNFAELETSSSYFEI